MNCSQVAAAFCKSLASAGCCRQADGNDFPDEGLLVVVLAVHLMFWAKIKTQPAISMQCHPVRSWTGLSGFVDFFPDGLVCPC